MNASAIFWDFSDLIPQFTDKVIRYHVESTGIKVEWASRTNEGVWANRNWLSIPGICFTGSTDSCLTGRFAAPNNVLFDEMGGEFIFRQPRNEKELLETMYAGFCDPFQEYGFDGHRNWTLPLVQQWWKDRRRIFDWLEQHADHSEWQRADVVEQKQLLAVREFQLHLIHEAEHYLRTFAFFLGEGRCATNDDRLPDIG